MLRKSLVVGTAVVGTAVLLLISSGILFGQGAAQMSPPVIRTDDGGITISVRVQNLTEGRTYRVGVGAVDGFGGEIKVELLTPEEADFSTDAMNFTQGYAKNWWGVPEVEAVGFEIGPSGLPGAGTPLSFRAEIPRSVVDNLDRIFVFISRDYGSERFYLEDHSPLDESYW